MIKSINDLNYIKEKTLELIKQKDGIRIVVGMATCGMAAGASPVYKALMEETKKLKTK